MRRQVLAWLEGRLPGDLRAITVRQPWAWAISHGFKPVENRNQALPSKFLGEIIAIHAGHAAINDDDVASVAKRARVSVDPTQLATGAIVGFARLVGSTRRRADLKKASDRRWFSGPHGWLLEDVTLLDRPVPCGGQLGFWRVPRSVRSKLLAQVTSASQPAPPKVFSWGYWGWGTAIRQAIEMFDAVENARGFRSPVFVDIRARREVRSEGFSGARSPFIRALGSSRYRWIQELGNAAVKTGRGQMRLIAPEAINELLGIVLRAQEEQRRVVFFCACASPLEFHSCHRRLVTERFVKVARALGVPVELEEWPGGAPRRAPVTVRVEAGEFDALCDGRPSIDLGRGRPAAKVLGLPVGAVVQVKSGVREAFASVLPPVFRRPRWQLPLFLFPFDEEDTGRSLVEAALRWRRKSGLVPHSTSG